MSYRGQNFTIGAAGAVSPAETGAGAEIETSRLGEEKELELARAVLAGDGETAGEICLKEHVRSLAEGEQRSGIGHMHDSGTTAVDSIRGIGRLLR